MNGHSVLLILSSLLLLLTTKEFNSMTIDYWERRAHLLEEENAKAIGGNLTFQENERIVNSILMAEKHKEIDIGFADPSQFLPAENFLTAMKKIEQSSVFQIIKNLPKGAVLHSHEFGLVSREFVYENITFRCNLYVCDDGDSSLRLQFFEEPNQDCDWLLLSSLRQNPKTAAIINAKILNAISMSVFDPDNAYPNVNVAWNKFFNIFIFIAPILTYRPVFEDYMYRALQELYDDNVMYVEIRSTLPNLYDLDGTVYEAVDVAKFVKRVSERFVRNNPDFLGMKLIYAPLRKVNVKTFDEYVSIAKKLKKVLPDFIAGFDLVGQEDKGEPLITFANKLKTMGKDTQFFFHAGETNWNGLSTDFNLIDAVLLNTKRIGHGFAALKHLTVLNLIKKKGITIEVNPISNQVLSLVRDLRNHPASFLFAQNYPVVVSCDDPGLWGAKGLSYDFYEAFVGIMSRDADLRALKQLAINSIIYSSLDDKIKQKALSMWQTKWDNFVMNFANQNFVFKQV